MTGTPYAHASRKTIPNVSLRYGIDEDLAGGQEITLFVVSDVVEHDHVFAYRRRLNMPEPAEIGLTGTREDELRRADPWPIGAASPRPGAECLY